MLLSCLGSHRNVSYFWWYLNQSTWNKLSLISPGVFKWLFMFLHGRTLKNMFFLLNNQTMNFRDSLWLNSDTFSKNTRKQSIYAWFQLRIDSHFSHQYIRTYIYLMKQVNKTGKYIADVNLLVTLDNWNKNKRNKWTK